MPATIVETRDLIETVVASIVAGVGVTTIFAIAIWGAARFAELSRDERPLAAGAAAVLTACALVATLAGVVLGIVAMTSK